MITRYIISYKHSFEAKLIKKIEFSLIKIFAT